MDDAPERQPGISRPSREQIRRFLASTDEERFQWWIGMLMMLHDAADARTRVAWQRGRRRYAPG
jgi:hypothetical protein